MNSRVLFVGRKTRIARVARRLMTLSFFLFTAELYCQSTNSTDGTNLFNSGTAAFSLAFRNSDSALMVARKVLTEARAAGDHKAEANAYNSIGWAHMHKGRLDTAINNLIKAREIFLSLRDSIDILRLDLNLAEVYTKQTQITFAIKFLMHADSLATALRHTVYQTDVKRQLAIVYREAGDDEKSARYFYQALEGFAGLRDYIRYINTSVSLGILYRKLNQTDSALLILNRALEMAEKHSGTPYQVAMTEENIAETYFEIKRYPEALHHYEMAYSIFEKLHNRADLAFEAFSVGKTLAHLGQFSKAEKYLLWGYHLSDSLKMTNYQIDASNELANLYKGTGQWQKAYTYLLLANSLTDSLDVRNQIATTNELKEKFEAEKKEREILLLKTANQLKEADNQRIQLGQYLLATLLLGSIYIGWLIFNRSRINRKLREHILRDRIAGDLHDDIGSTLSSIYINSRMALEKKDDSIYVAKKLTAIGNNSREILDSVSDIVWSINPDNDNFESVVTRMRSFAAELCEPLQIGLLFTVQPGMANLSLDQSARRNLLLLFKECVNNAAKHSGCKSLSIAMDTSSRGLTMTVSDDGSGFDEAKSKKGHGLKSMRIRAEQLRASIEINSIIGSGTRIEMKIPL